MDSSYSVNSTDSLCLKQNLSALAQKLSVSRVWPQAQQEIGLFLFGSLRPDRLHGSFSKIVVSGSLLSEHNEDKYFRKASCLDYLGRVVVGSLQPI